MTQDFLPGWHLLLDMHGARHLQDAEALEAVLRAAAKAAGARVLSAHMHGFPGRGGVTGVVLLAESHISIHTWPELDYAALDIFMCGSADVEAAARVLEKALEPRICKVTRTARGQTGAAAGRSEGLSLAPGPI
ncbi:adenosylmethionine decarboxylase [Stagnihabitans tardus]|uniref:Adenosylmethionine decarboxylase n=1 Tax=Stagnihabitans tardus TaxID=2699202 RepID=A0AAE4Y6V6_9RHOB|nr:adenosylmethionine decarboxylase [Stagnihabitans tardus]NBZ86908.1 adenosylmethionine decarboxylase [Stagnihabitans tardus]